MKNAIYFLAIIFLVSCGNQKEVVVSSTPKVKAMEINKTVPYKETVILLGPANEDGFKQEPFNTWYEENYADYEVDKTTISSLKHLLKNVKVKAFMGTWCGDSKRETPRFFKIMEATDYNDENIELITMSRQKDTPEGSELGLNITNVPTFIFYKNGEEINRIVESPITSLEKDMIAILTGQEYKHTYAN